MMNNNFTRYLFKMMVCGLLLVIAKPATAQTDIDGLMMEKKFFCVGPTAGYSSWKNYWEGTLKRENLNMGRVSTTNFTLMGNYGITHRLNLLFGLPYVKTKASAGNMAGQKGLQDLSVMLKWVAYQKHIASGDLKTFLIAGYTTPVSNYNEDFLPLSIGLHSKNATMRLMADYQRNHWFATATPSFLIKLLRQQQLPAYTLDAVTTDSKLLDSADVNQISIISLLFQTGYLTVKQVRRSFQGDEYDLGYPNHEVAQSFQQLLLTDYLTANIDQISITLLANLRKALHAQNVEGFIATLQSVFGSIPHTLFLPQEAYYHSVVYLVLRLLGFTVDVERLNNLGRLDAVLELSDVVYILEFKMSEPAPKPRKRKAGNATGSKRTGSRPSPAQLAIEQIRTKQYDLPFRGRGKTILLLGIAFDQEHRNISEWLVEKGDDNG